MLQPTIPTEKNERDVIVLIDEVEVNYLRLQKDSRKRAWIEKPNICVLQCRDGRPLQDSRKHSSLYEKLDKDLHLVEGHVLIKQPYRQDDYEVMKDNNANSFLQSNIKEDYGIYASFCGALGARSVKIEHMEMNGKKIATEVEAGGRIKFVKGNGKISGSWEDSLNCILQMSYEFKKRPFDIKRANDFLEKNNLSTDRRFLRLMDDRQMNELEHKTESFSLVEKSRAVLQVAAEISFPLFNANGKFQLEIDQVKSLAVKVVIDF